MVVEPEEVLAFWLGGDQRENYRTKWFVSNPIEQMKVDAEIFERFGESFESAFRRSLDQWKSDVHTFIALIILLDQFSRHIFRHLNLPVDDEKRKDADALALQAAMELTAIPDWQSRLSAAERVFVLMPFRHNASLSRLKFVVDNIDTLEASLEWERSSCPDFEGRLCGGSKGSLTSSRQEMQTVSSKGKHSMPMKVI